MLKVILGLLEPTSGDVLIDGVPLRILGHEAFRKSIGVVMQDDQLLSGSIADNICFFDKSFDLDHMVHCAELAGIHEDICHMPIAYNSLIGDMGTSLSGGRNSASCSRVRSTGAPACCLWTRAPRISTSPPSGGSRPL